MIWTTKAAHERKLTFTSPKVTFLDVAGARVRPVTFTSPKVTFLDVAGARVRPARAGNVVTLTLSGSPIYFFGGELKELP